jgi:hypothetical protein
MGSTNGITKEVRITILAPFWQFVGGEADYGTIGNLDTCSPLPRLPLHPGFLHVVKTHDTVVDER